jgi:TolB-like protein
LAGAIAAGSFAHFGRSALVTALPARDPASIAVLPFLNLTNDKESEILSDALTEELINSLVRIPGLHVMAGPSSSSIPFFAIRIRPATSAKLAAR